MPNKAAAIARQRRHWLTDSLRRLLLPKLAEQGFDIAAHVSRGPVDREFLLALPLGRLIRQRSGLVDLMEVEFAPHRAAAFRLVAGVAPPGGLPTFNGLWAPEDLYAGWLDECFVTHARPRLKTVTRAIGSESLGSWFSVWHWPWQHPALRHYEELALRAARVVPELDLALREGKVGPHIQRIFTEHPKPNREMPTASRI